MDSTNREEMNNRRRYAEEELYKMQERATMPPVPPFVRTGGAASEQREAQNNGRPISEEPPKSEEYESRPNANGAVNSEEYPNGDSSGGPTVFRPPHKNPSGFGGLLSKDIFKLLNVENLELGSDRMLILLMILLLSGENSDNILLFALAYIML